MSRRGLYQLELEYRRKLEKWRRTRDSKTRFRPAYPLPTDLPIQGLTMPSSVRKTEKRSLDWRNGSGKPQRNFRRNGRRAKALKLNTDDAESLLCSCCDFWDRMCRRCLLKRLNHECPYVNGVYSHMKNNGGKR